MFALEESGELFRRPLAVRNTWHSFLFSLQCVDFLTFAYKFGTYVKIEEFVEFRERLKNSLHYVQTTVERVLLNVLSNPLDRTRAYEVSTSKSLIAVHTTFEQMSTHLIWGIGVLASFFLPFVSKPSVTTTERGTKYVQWATKVMTPAYMYFLWKQVSWLLWPTVQPRLS